MSIDNKEVFDLASVKQIQHYSLLSLSILDRNQNYKYIYFQR